MGYSTGFLRGILALTMLVALAGLCIGAANEIFGLGLFTSGYPAPLGGGEGAEFGSYAIQLGVIAAVSTVANLALERHDG
jgi:hypothetical protein